VLFRSVVWKDTVHNKFFDALAASKPTASNFEGSSQSTPEMRTLA